jgi:hypothetical protein
LQFNKKYLTLAVKYKKMKKVFTILASAALMLGAAYAQRTVDIETSLVTPANGVEVRSATPVTLTFTVSNNGPDAIKPGDTLTGFAILGNQLQTQTLTRLSTTESMAMGASKNFTMNIGGITGGQSGDLNLCVFVVLNQKAGADTVVDNLLGGNNIGCNTVKYVNTASVFDAFTVSTLSSSNYPNPASDNINIVFSAPGDEKTTVTIFDITGKVMFTKEFATNFGENNLNISLSDLSNGTYFYELNNNGHADRKKFVVSK